MANTFAPEVAGLGNSPVGNANGGVQGGRVRVWRATIEYNGQQAGDTITLAKIPAGHSFLYGVMTATATAGATATIAIGAAGATGKYRAAAVYTAANTPAVFGPAATMIAAPLAADETVIATIAEAALPNSADYAVVELYFSAP